MPIEMSESASVQPTTAAAQAPAPQQTSTAPAVAAPQGSITPHSNPEAEGLLRQADMLKEQQLESQKAQSAMEKELSYYRTKAKAEAEEYKKVQEPKVKEYIDQLEATTGDKLTEQERLAYFNAFTNPTHKKDADRLFKQHQQTVELVASKKKFEQELAVERSEKAKLAEMVAKASQQVGGMRKSYADSLNVAAEQQQMEPARKEVSVGASLNANEIMCAAPSATELPFLQTYGFSNEVGVNASGSGFMTGSKPFRTSITAAREHSHLIDEEGDLQFPHSARYHNPTRFAWMVNEATFQQTDLSNFVAINASKTFIEERRVD